MHAKAVSLPVRCSAPVLSVTSHWLQSPPDPPHGHSSQCQSNADSGPWSAMLMLSLCACMPIHVCVHSSVCFLQHACVCVQSCVLFFFLFLGDQRFFFLLLSLFPEGTERDEGASLQWQSEERRSETTERSWEKSGEALQQQQAEGKEDDSAF